MDSIRFVLSDRVDDPDFIDWVCEKEGRFRFIMYTGMEALDKNLEELELTFRTYNCLKRAGYDTVRSLVEDIDWREELLRIRNMGKKNADEIMMKLFLYTYENLKPGKRKAYLDKVRSLD